MSDLGAQTVGDLLADQRLLGGPIVRGDRGTCVRLTVGWIGEGWRSFKLGRHYHWNATAALRAVKSASGAGD